VIGNIATLSRWEWFKLRKRWMLWILLVFAILFGQLAVWGGFFSYQNLKSTGGELTVPATLQQNQGRVPRTVACNDLLSGDPAKQPADLDPQVLTGLTAQCRQQAASLPDRLARAYQGFTLPGSFSSALSVVQTLALILVAIITASAIGIDYGSGTLRSVLTKGTGRWPYLTAKLLTLAILTALGLVVTLATVAISSVIAGAYAGDAPVSSAAARTWGDAGVALAKSWVSVLPYLGLTTFVTVLARSSAAGMAIGLGYYFLEQILIALLSGLFSWFQNVADFLLVRNISAFTQGTAAAGSGFPSPAGLPDATHAIIVLSIYALALFAGAFWLFERRDVQGATAG
jgi:ABC-type transport system involved in multi-copper enzyme maturation permease subunit